MEMAVLDSGRSLPRVSAFDGHAVHGGHENLVATTLGRPYRGENGIPANRCPDGMTRRRRGSDAVMRRSPGTATSAAGRWPEPAGPYSVEQYRQAPLPRGPRRIRGNAAAMLAPN